MSRIELSVENGQETGAVHMAAGAVFHWRRGHWHRLSGPDSKSTRLPHALSRKLAQLKTEGNLHEGPPGYFRIQRTTATALFDDCESPLMRLAALRNADGTAYLDEALVAAGERMRRDFETSGLSQRTTATYAEGTGVRSWPAADNATARLTDAALAARQRLHKAMDAVGPELSGILLDVCCLAAGLEQAEMRLELPRRAGKAVLLLALTRLARHYGLKARLHHKGPADIGHWALGDFRPVIAQRAEHPT